LELIYLSEEKKSRGRPRKYKDDAEKQKVFREKKKEQFKQLEERINELEAIIEEGTDPEKEKKMPWFSWSFQNLKDLNINELQEYKREIKKILGRQSIHSPVKIIIDKVIKKSQENVADVLIRKEVLKSARAFDESLFHLTILHLINNQIVSLADEIDLDYEIELAEQRISDLEAEIKEKKKQKISVVKQAEQN
jgi:hypothetical protein